MGKLRKISVHDLSRKRFATVIVLFISLLAAYINIHDHMQILAAGSGTLSLTPASGTESVGSTFTVSIYENSSTTAINAVESDLTFPASKLQFVSIDSSTSAFGVEAAASGDNTNGTVTVGRGVSGGSSLTGNQLVTTVTFKAIGVGAAPINFNTTSSAIVESTTNTNVLGSETNGSYTVADTSAPSVPSGLAVSAHSVTSLTVGWTASTDNVGVTGYKIYRGGTQIGTSATASYTDSGLTPNTSYSYTIAAYDAAGNTSSQSIALAAKTDADTSAPSVPAAPTQTSNTMTSMVIGWTASTDNVGVTGYNIYRNGTKVGTSATNSYTDTGLSPGTAYSYTTSAYDAAGNTSAQSSAASLSTVADTAAPTTPSGLTVNYQTSSRVNLSWTASTDNVGVTGYNIYRNGAKIGTAASTSYSDTTVSPGASTGTTYDYQVSAVDGSGNESTLTTAVSSTVPRFGDLNGDNQVNIFDLSILLSNYGKSVSQAGNKSADINGDGTVSVLDLSLLLSHFLQ